MTKAPDIRRQEIIEKALKLFLDNGYEQTAVADIVRSSGIAQGTFYLYFSTKHEVLEAAAARLVAPLTDHVRTVASDGALPAAERVRQVLDVVMTTLAKHQQLIARLLEQGNALLHAQVGDNLWRALLPAMTTVVEDGVREGSFVVACPEETTELLLAILTHLTKTHGAERDAARLERLRRAVMTVFFRALSAQE